MIIGLSGKKQVGKNTVADMIQYLTEYQDSTYSEYTCFNIVQLEPPYEYKSFAGKLKKFVADIIGCSLKQLEDEEFKNTEFGYDWDDGNFTNHTPRTLLQQIGTEVGRLVHPNIHVLGLMIDYRPIDPENSKYDSSVIDYKHCKFPNWLITDIRFPNERAAIRQRNGIVFKVIRKTDIVDNHASETAMTNEVWKGKHVIENTGTLEELYQEVRTKLFINKLIEEEYDRKK